MNTDKELAAKLITALAHINNARNNLVPLAPKSERASWALALESAAINIVIVRDELRTR